MAPSAGGPQRLWTRTKHKPATERKTLKGNHFRGDAAEPVQRGSLQRMNQWGSKPQMGTQHQEQEAVLSPQKEP